MEFIKDLENRKIYVKREFKASPEEVWEAWTTKEMLDEWWAPKPWKTETESLDLRVGGRWRYAMVGPEGEKHHCLVEYDKIVPNKFFSGLDGFCDENGNILSDPPGMQWACTFESSGSGTMVSVEVTFKSEEDLEKIIGMGFREGFTSALGNLDEIFEQDKY